jgi:hypothetical protein
MKEKESSSSSGGSRSQKIFKAEKILKATTLDQLAMSLENLKIACINKIKR